MTCQKFLADAPWMENKTRRLPGVQPLDFADWIVVDDAFTAQMRDRTRVLAKHRDEVMQQLPDADAAVEELLQTVIAHLHTRRDFIVFDRHCVRPDGVEIALDVTRPLDTLCHLVTEDFCILQKIADEHVLTAGLLCFPASWMLAEKFGKPLTAIHDPVDSYDDGIARRVQRLFDAVQVDRPLWRANALLYHDPTLYQPRPEDARRIKGTDRTYLRSERQCILRLPKTQAVVFSIQTRQVHISNLTPAQRDSLAATPVDIEEAQ